MFGSGLRTCCCTCTASADGQLQDHCFTTGVGEVDYEQVEELLKKAGAEDDEHIDRLFDAARGTKELHKSCQPGERHGILGRYRQNNLGGCDHGS